MGVDIKLEPEAAREVVQKAIIGLLDEEARDGLIQSAVESLLKRPEKDRYSSTQLPSPLEVAFENAVRQISTQVVREYLEDDKVASAIREQILAVLKKLIDDKGTWLYDQIGYAVGQKITEVLTEGKSY